MRVSNELCRWAFLLFGLTFCFAVALAVPPLTLPGYDLTWILPFWALFCFVFLLWKPLTLCRTPFLALFSVVIFLRYDLLSWVMLFCESFDGVSGCSPAESSLEAALGYMMLELGTASLTIRLLYARSVEQSEAGYDCGTGPIPVYAVFIAVSAMLLLFTPAARSGFMLFSTGQPVQESLSFWALGVRECFDNARFFLLFCLIFAVKSRAVPAPLAVFLLGAGAAVAVGVQVGTNRKIIAASALALACVLTRVYPQKRKSIFLALGGLAVLLVISTTLYRAAATGVDGVWLRQFSPEYLQAYLLGQYNTALGLEAAALGRDISLTQAFMELLRPVFGVGSLLKEHCVMLSKLYFDSRMSMGLDALRKDQILPMAMQGQMFFGLSGTVSFTLIPVFCGWYCDRLYRSSPSLELSFLGAYLAFYFAQSMILNMTILINNVTFMMAIFLPVFWLGRMYARLRR
ncbi:hypothetical protein [Mailhella sp.]|uniref:hypothetical protein n=1 Tax=Mailhella sp. TaxID=1981029 RepID=UPI00406368F1